MYNIVRMRYEHKCIKFVNVYILVLVHISLHNCYIGISTCGYEFSYEFKDMNLWILNDDDDADIICRLFMLMISDDNVSEGHPTSGIDPIIYSLPNCTQRRWG